MNLLGVQISSERQSGVFLLSVYFGEVLLVSILHIVCVIVCVCAYVCIYMYIVQIMYKYYSVDQVLGYVAQVAYCGLLLRSYLGEADVVGDLNIFDV